MYCVMRTSVPSLYNVYRRYDYVAWTETVVVFKNAMNTSMAVSGVVVCECIPAFFGPIRDGRSAEMIKKKVPYAKLYS